MAFILGFPANEIVLPIILMTYLGTGTLTEAENLAALGGILQANGWTVCTALCTLVFTLLHWPCAATCATLYRETHSVKTVLWAILIPTATGCIPVSYTHLEVSCGGSPPLTRGSLPSGGRFAAGGYIWPCVRRGRVRPS